MSAASVAYLPLPDESSPALVSRCASEITAEPIEWLWPGRIARGKHTCIAGEPGAGKSQLSIAIISAITTGAEWPCGEGRAIQGSAIILSAEDGAGDTIVPRLHAAGADLGSVQIIEAVKGSGGKGRRDLQADLELLEKEITRIGDVVLVSIDPISSYMGKTDSHKNSEVRGVLEPIGEMAERMRVAILSVTHFSKAGANTNTKALHRFIGSIAFVGAPRAAFAVIEDTDKDRRLFLHAKNNLAPAPQGLAFRLQQTIVDPDRNIVASCARWEPEPVSMTANDALAADAAGDSNRSAIEEAMEFLRDLLSEGCVPAKEVKAEANSAGQTWATVRRAKDRIGITPRREGFGDDGVWVWELPKVLKFLKDAHV
jgi:putative DNA primase/helicase